MRKKHKKITSKSTVTFETEPEKPPPSNVIIVPSILYPSEGSTCHFWLQTIATLSWCIHGKQSITPPLHMGLKLMQDWRKTSKINKNINPELQNV